ncbi:hypothetical protein Tco_0766485 [Tanacetum coccineum]
MAYWVDLIRRIEYESASIVVEIDLTWSLGFVSVELASIEARISLIKLEFSSCLFADSLINLLRVSSIDYFRSWERLGELVDPHELGAWNKSTISENFLNVFIWHPKGTKACDDTGKARMETVPGKYYILLPLWPANPLLSQNSKSSPDAGFKSSGDNEKKVTEEPRKEGGDSSNDQEKEDDNVNSTNNINTASDGNNTNNVNAVSSTVNAAGIEVNDVGAKTSIELPYDPNMLELEAIVYSDDDENVGAEAGMNNLNTFIPVSPIPTTRIHKDHPIEQIIRDLNLAPQTRRMTKDLKEHGLSSSVQQRTNHKDCKTMI